MSNRRTVRQDDQDHAQQILGLQAALDEANQLVDHLRGRTTGLNAQARIQQAQVEQLQRQVAELSAKVPADDDTPSQEPT